MVKRSPFEVDVSDLLGRDVPPRPVVVEAVVDWRLEMSRIMADPPLVAELSLAPVPGGILVRGEVCCAVEHTCRRCLGEFVDAGVTGIAYETITDTRGTIVYTNPAEATMHGYGVDELVGRALEDVVAGALRVEQVEKEHIR